MRVLLDTHTFLWVLEDSPRISARAREVVHDVRNEAFLSTASLWEIAIKVSTAKLTLDRSFDEVLAFIERRRLLALMPVAPVHIAAVIELPFHHRDPFDRMLVAQTLAEDLSLVSNDDVLDAYGIRRMW
jgi:PIN domain nuclease of toxin-antitoxin system